MSSDADTFKRLARSAGAKRLAGVSSVTSVLALMSDATLAQLSLNNRLMQDNLRVLGSLFKSFLIKSVKGLSSGEPGEVATECKKCHGFDSFICQTFHNVAFKTYFTSSLFEHRFSVTKTHGGKTPAVNSQVYKALHMWLLTPDTVMKEPAL